MLATVPVRWRSSGPGSAVLRILLQHEHDLALLAHGLLDGGDGRRPADRERQDDSREQHHVAHRHDDHGVGRQRHGWSVWLVALMSGGLMLRPFGRGPWAA